MEYHHLTELEVDTDEGTVEEIGRYRLGERPEAAVEDQQLPYEVLED